MEVNDTSQSDIRAIGQTEPNGYFSKNVRIRFGGVVEARGIYQIDDTFTMLK